MGPHIPPPPSPPALRSSRQSISMYFILTSLFLNVSEEVGTKGEKIFSNRISEVKKSAKYVVGVCKGHCCYRMSLFLYVKEEVGTKGERIFKNRMSVLKKSVKYVVRVRKGHCVVKERVCFNM